MYSVWTTSTLCRYPESSRVVQVALTLNGRARTVPGPTTLSRSATLQMGRQSNKCRAGQVLSLWCCDLLSAVLYMTIPESPESCKEI